MLAALKYIIRYANGVLLLEMNTATQISGSSNTTTTAATQPSRSSITATQASKLVLISSLINNINNASARQDSIYVIAAIIGLIATYLTDVSAYQEAGEQQIAPGVTTFANGLKMLSANMALIAGAIAFWALLIEVNLRAQGISAPQTQAHSANPTVTSSVLSQ